MIEAIMMAAGHPATAWTVLIGSALIVLFEAWRVSGSVLWGDMFADEIED